MKRSLTLACFLLMTISLVAQQTSYTANDISINQFVEGTLVLPKPAKNVPLAIIIGGSGPVDRDGNQPMARNNMYKKLAETLAQQGIASFRYDKRIRKAIALDIDEADMRFEDFITDASTAITHFKESGKFSSIYVIGHSQGALVGMYAGAGKMDGFISIAGAGRSIDEVLLHQIQQQVPGLKKEAKAAFEQLKDGKRARHYPKALHSIFKPSLQGFMHSWISHSPQEQIQQLSVPVLIINGTKDLQTDVQEAQFLKKAKTSATLVIIENMNHVLRIIDEDDDLVNQKTYNQPNLAISEELINHITAFIKS